MTTPARRLATLATTALLASGLVAGTAPASAGAVPIPVDCDEGTVTLRWDDVTYDLDGACGTVRVLADDVTVRMGTGRTVLVRGRRNTVVSKALDTLRLEGRGHEVRPRSVRVLRVASPGSRVEVEGLLETARMVGRRAAVTADQVSTLRVPGSGNTVRTGRGFDATVGGDGNTLRYRRLETVGLEGDDNSVRVRRGVTEVRDSGARNRVTVARRG